MVKCIGSKTRLLTLKQVIPVIYAQIKIDAYKGGVQLILQIIRSTLIIGHSTYTNLLLKDTYSSTGTILSQRSTSLANLTGNGNDKN